MNKLRCRSFHRYIGQRRPTCNLRQPCTACTLLHFLVWYDGYFQEHPDEARQFVEDYIRRFPE